MKKLLKRIIAIAFVAILFTAPSNALAASTSMPVLIFNQEGIKYFEYQPSPYYLSSNTSVVLEDTTTADKWWDIPANHESTNNFYLKESGYFRVMVFERNEGLIYDTGVINDFYHQIRFPAQTTAKKYQIWVTAYTPINITGYDGFLFNEE